MSSQDKSEQFAALGARLKFLREQWHQSLQDVCETLEIDEKTLQALEAGKMAPTAEMLDMLISHFLLTEDQAQDMRDLISDQSEDSDGGAPALEELINKQIVMFMPVDNRVVYTDSMQATVTDNGVVLQFLQQVNGQQMPVSKVGMSRQHAEKVIEVLQKTLKHHDDHGQKKLPSPDNQQNQ